MARSTELAVSKGESERRHRSGKLAAVAAPAYHTARCLMTVFLACVYRERRAGQAQVHAEEAQAEQEAEDALHYPAAARPREEV